MADEPTNPLEDALNEANSRWQHGITPFTDLTPEQKRQMLGDDPSAEELAFELEFDLGDEDLIEPNFAPAVDWRNHNGNHVTSVKNQSFCGSCVSFTIASLVESMASIEHGQLLNLSEADLHFCSSHGANCQGWWGHHALTAVQHRGIPDEAYFPYEKAFEHGTEPQCFVGQDREDRVVKVTDFYPLYDHTARRNHLTNVGPLYMSFDVYDDFFSYQSGVYHHVSGDLSGGHAVMVVGYSEDDQAWICKNSWGAGWGEAGFFKIGYFECGIPGRPMYGCTGVQMPTREKQWWGYAGVGGMITSAPAVSTLRGDLRLAVVARGVGSDVFMREMVLMNGHKWQTWQSLGGAIQGNPSICSSNVNRADIFATNMRHNLIYKWYQNGGSSDWYNLGGELSSSPCAVSAYTGTMHIFARSPEGKLWMLWTRGNGWNGWTDLGGGLAGAPSACVDENNNIHVFVRGHDNKLWTRHFEGTFPQPWQNLGVNLISDPTAVAANGDIHVFYSNMQFRLAQRSRSSNWAEEINLGGRLCNDVGATSWTNGRIDVFVQGVDSAVYHKWQV